MGDRRIQRVRRSPPDNGAARRWRAMGSPVGSDLGPALLPGHPPARCTVVAAPRFPPPAAGAGYRLPGHDAGHHLPQPTQERAVPWANHAPPMAAHSAKNIIAHDRSTDRCDIRLPVCHLSFRKSFRQLSYISSSGRRDRHDQTTVAAFRAVWAGGAGPHGDHMPVDRFPIGRPGATITEHDTLTRDFAKISRLLPLQRRPHPSVPQMVAPPPCGPPLHRPWTCTH